jgi:hypothetical protein
VATENREGVRLAAGCTACDGAVALESLLGCPVLALLSGRESSSLMAQSSEQKAIEVIEYPNEHFKRTLSVQVDAHLVARGQMGDSKGIGDRESLAWRALFLGLCAAVSIRRLQIILPWRPPLSNAQRVPIAFGLFAR